ncbi:MAG: efflux RND transporter permease subunit [Acidobacteriota bacterium]|nr:efflux RND transporter permease subunit [Acidobacteriota bacterium]
MDGELPDPKHRSTGVITWFVRNRVAANLIFFGVCLAGYLAAGGVPHEMLPQTSPSAIQVQVVLPGASAEAVAEQVLIGLEETLRGVSGIGAMNGVAVHGVAVLALELEPGADVREAGDRIRARLSSLATLPSDAENPVVTEVEASTEILRIAVYGEADESSLLEAAHRAQDAVTAVPGVLRVERLTGRDRELVIEIPEENLTRFGLTFDQVTSAVWQATAETPAGTVRRGSREVVVRSKGAAFGADDFARIPLIGAPDGGKVRLGDIGSVVDGFDTTGREAWMNGVPAVLLSVRLAANGRLQETTDGVVDALRALALPDGFTATPWYFAAETFSDRLDMMVRNGLFGLGLIFLVLFFTLSTRLAVWTAAGLPFTFLGAFLLMPGLGVTVNLISMFGFIAALGVVVDDAIVVGESVQSRMDRAREGNEEAAIRGTRKVFVPAAFGVFTTMAAFTPLIGIPGVQGELVADLPRVVIAILGFSLIEAALVLPHHMAHGGLNTSPSRRLARIRGLVQSGFAWTSREVYRPALRWALANRLATLALGFFSLSLALGLVAGRQVPFTSASPVDTNLVNVLVELPPGSPPEATRGVVRWVEGVLDEVRDEIRHEFGVEVERRRAVLVGQQFPVGVGESFGGQSAGAGAALGQVIWRLTPAEDREAAPTRSIADRLRSRLRQAPGDAEISVVTDAFGQQADISIRISGARRDGLRAASSALQTELGGLPGVTSVRDDLRGEVSGFVARMRNGGAGTGIPAASFGRQLRQAFYGEEIRRIHRGRDEVRVLVRSRDDESGGVFGLSAMPVRRPDGQVSLLGAVAEVTRDSNEAVIRRVDSSPAITVLADVDAVRVLPDAVIAEARERILPALGERFPEYDFRVTGAAGETQEGQAALARNGLLAVMLIFVLLAVPLGSWIQPFVILAAIPFALAGAIYGHFIIGIPLEMMSLFGMAPLVGIAVNDALVMLDFINRNRARGRSARESAMEAGPARFRAIILTSVTTCAGVAPLIFESSFQAALLIPMAVSLAFGVAFATSVTLFLIPVLYSLASDATAALSVRGSER